MSEKRHAGSTRKIPLAFIILLPFVVAFSLWLPGRINVVISSSLSHRIFFLCKVPAKIETGDYMVFKNDDRYVSRFIRKTLTKPDLLTKQVGCSPGELLIVGPERIFNCNGTYIGQALKKDSRGETLPVFTFHGIVPKDSYFMIGSNPRSFDSKYFGFIKKDEIVYKAYPLW